MVWCFQRLFVKAPSGRQRVKVFAALHAITHEVLTVQNLTDITAETVCELLRLVASSQSGVPVTVILDNARDQRCALVQTVAETLGMELLYFPTYAPNLHLSERFWKFVKKPCLDSKYYPDSASFQQAMMTCIEQAPMCYKKALESLLTRRFQTFRAVSVIGEPHTVPKRSRKKVLSKAA
jgi:transposase